jgi:outer membrane receptor protein involved in Fe transport
MIRCIFHWVIFFIPSLLIAASPEGVIRGRVLDQASGSGLPGVDILFGTNHGTITDASGFYLLSAPSGKITLSFRHIGYKSLKKDVELFENDTVVLNVALEYEMTNIDQVVVSAGRIEQRISELAVSMNLIKPGFFSGNHITDTKELINKIPGIEVLDGQASIRGGSGFSYGAGSRVLALIDGLPVIASDAGSIRWQYLPLENVSQIEIIKGASSVAYGSSALNGVINFRTADATEKPITQFYLESGIFGDPPNRDWKWWSSPRIFMSASFSHLQKLGNTGLGVGAFVMNDNGYRRLTGNRLGRINLKLKHRNKNRDGLSYGFSFNGGNTVKSDFILWENATNGALRQDESTAIELHGNFFTFDPFISFSPNQRSKHDFRSRFQFSDNNYPDSGQNESEAFNYYAEYQWNYAFTGKLMLISGLAQNLTRVNSRFYGNHQGWNAGAYIQLDYNATSRLRITSGIRIEHNRLDGANDKITPLLRAGLNFRAFDYTFVRASFGQGYRFPSVAEKYAATTLGSVKIFPNPYIQSEKGWNAETGFKQGIVTGNFSGMVDVAFFYLQNIDMIEYIFGIYPDPGEATYSFGFKAENQEASRVYGTELQFALTNSTRGFTSSVSGGYTYMYPVEFNKVTKKNTGVMLKYRRKHSAVLNLSTVWKKAELGIGLYAKSKILNIDDVFLSELTREKLLPGFFDYWGENNRSYMTADVSLGYEIIPKYRVSFVIKNVTNTEYMGRPGDIQPHRNFSLRFSGNL